MKQEQFVLIINSNYDKKENLITEIKGNMRFWFRLINSNQNNHGHMYYIESVLFGDAKNNRSPISIHYKSIDKNICTLEINLRAIFNNKNFEQLCKLLSNFANTVDALEKAKNIVVNKNIEWYINLLKLSLTLGDLGKKSRKLHNLNTILRLVTIDETNNATFNIVTTLNDVNLLNKNAIIQIETLKNFSFAKIHEKITNDFKLHQAGYLIYERRNLQLGKIYKLENVKNIKKGDLIFSNTCYNWLEKKSSIPRNRYEGTLINVSSVKNIDSFDIYISVFMSANKNSNTRREKDCLNKNI